MVFIISFTEPQISGVVFRNLVLRFFDSNNGTRSHRDTDTQTDVFDCEMCVALFFAAIEIIFFKHFHKLTLFMCLSFLRYASIRDSLYFVVNRFNTHTAAAQIKCQSKFIETHHATWIRPSFVFEVNCIKWLLHHMKISTYNDFRLVVEPNILGRRVSWAPCVRGWRIERHTHAQRERESRRKTPF